MAGGEKLLEGAMRESELPLAVAFALAEQQAGALLDVVDDDRSLVPTVAEQRPEGAEQAAPRRCRPCVPASRGYRRPGGRVHQRFG
jgi:hypothetical protein